MNSWSSSAKDYFNKPTATSTGFHGGNADDPFDVASTLGWDGGLDTVGAKSPEPGYDPGEVRGKPSKFSMTPGTPGTPGHASSSIMGTGSTQFKGGPAEGLVAQQLAIGFQQVDPLAYLKSFM